jgi:hypothetical protein
MLHWLTACVCDSTSFQFNAKTSFLSETASAARSGSLPQHIFEVVYEDSPASTSTTSGAGMCLYSSTPHNVVAAALTLPIVVSFALDALQRYQSVSQKHGTVVGYHASSLENFHSILWNGLDTKYAKQGLFGEGNAPSAPSSRLALIEDAERALTPLTQGSIFQPMPQCA